MDILQLERLESRSLVERLGEGMNLRIGMHDLWRAFCEAEAERGELGCRRWVMQDARKSSELLETSPSGSCWENVKRMSLVYCGVRGVERVNFGHFVNVRVLRILGLCVTRKVVVDVSRLWQLKSLEVSGRFLHRLVLQGLPKSLIFVSIDDDPDFSESTGMQFLGDLYKRWETRSKSSQWIREIGFLKELQYIRLNCYGGGKLPDMRSMVSLRKVMFRWCESVVSVTGLSSKLTNLRVLDLTRCEELRTCHGVGDLVALEELDLGGCGKLKGLPNLQKLRNLRRLDISCCQLINEVPGLGDLVALEKFFAGGLYLGRNDFKVPDMRKLSHLQVLQLRGCPVEAAAGLDSLVSLQILEADFRWVQDRPSLKQLTRLVDLDICGWSAEELGELDDMAMLQNLEIGNCLGVEKLPDIRGLISLQRLGIQGCDFKDVSSLSSLAALKRLAIAFCSNLERVPNLETLSELFIFGCDMLRGLDSTVGEVEGNVWRSDETSVESDPPDPQRFRNLRELRLQWCKSLADLTSIGSFSQLERLECTCLLVSELPDLSNFPRLEWIKVLLCESLRRLTSREPIHALSYLVLRECSSLTTLPDLGMLPSLKELLLEGCSGLTTLRCSRPLRALEVLDVRGCSSLSGDALDQLRAMLCTECEIKQDILDVHVDTGVGRKWMWRAVGAGGMVLALGWIFRSLRHSQALQTRN